MAIHRLADVSRRFSKNSPVIKIPVTYTGWEVDFRGHVLHNSSMMAGRKTAHSFSSSAALAGSHVMSQLRSAEGVGAVLTHCVDTAALIFQGERACYMFVLREGKKHKPNKPNKIPGSYQQVWMCHFKENLGLDLAKHFPALTTFWLRHCLVATHHGLRHTAVNHSDKVMSSCAWLLSSLNQGIMQCRQLCYIKVVIVRYDVNAGMSWFRVITGTVIIVMITFPVKVPLIRYSLNIPRGLCPALPQSFYTVENHYLLNFTVTNHHSKHCKH